MPSFVVAELELADSGGADLCGVHTSDSRHRGRRIRGGGLLRVRLRQGVAQRPGGALPRAPRIRQPRLRIEL